MGWTWKPEDNVPLSNEIKMEAWEESAINVWSEFLAGHFDGGNHYGITWPAGVILCQQARIAQPMDGIAIQIVTPVPGQTIKRWSAKTGTYQNWNPESFTFIVRAQLKGGRTDGQNSESLCRSTADLLYRLCNTPAWRMPLIRAGVLNIKPTPHQVLDENVFATRRMMVKALISPPVSDAIGTMPALDVPSDNVVLELTGSPYSVPNGRTLRIYGRTSTGALQVTLPPNPTDGQTVLWKDVDGVAETNIPTISGNGKLVILNGQQAGVSSFQWPINNGSVKLNYVVALGVWQIV